MRSLALARNPGLAIPDEIGDLLSLEALYLDESELEAVPDAHLRDLAVDRFLVLAVVLLLLVFLRDSAAQIATTGRGVSVIGPPASVALAAEVAQRRMCPYALLTIPAIAIEESGVGQPWHTIASIFDSIVWTAFFADAALMLNAVEEPWRWVREHPLDVAIVVLTPPFLPASMQAARVFRLLRLLRLLRLGLLARRPLSTEGVRDAAVLAAMTILAGGAGYAAVEKGEHL